jgi:hypothetical protein
MYWLTRSIVPSMLLIPAEVANPDSTARSLLRRAIVTAWQARGQGMLAIFNHATPGATRLMIPTVHPGLRHFFPGHRVH